MYFVISQRNNICSRDVGMECERTKGDRADSQAFFLPVVQAKQKSMLCQLIPKGFLRTQNSELWWLTVLVA